MIVKQIIRFVAICLCAAVQIPMICFAKDISGAVAYQTFQTTYVINDLLTVKI